MAESTQFAVIMVGTLYYQDEFFGKIVRLAKTMPEAFHFVPGSEVLMAINEQLRAYGLTTEIKTVTLTLEDY